MNKDFKIGDLVISAFENAGNFGMIYKIEKGKDDQPRFLIYWLNDKPHTLHYARYSARYLQKLS